ncbi:hypothetical protein NX905_29580, partial [Burkholderia thailandensis]|nr:hypothetical protein [Burkholderia thailandensis]
MRDARRQGRDARLQVGKLSGPQRADQVNARGNAPRDRKRKEEREEEKEGKEGKARDRRAEGQKERTGRRSYVEGMGGGESREQERKPVERKKRGGAEVKRGIEGRAAEEEELRGGGDQKRGFAR